MRLFLKPIEDFADVFVILQGQRNLADYDPLQRFDKSEVATAIAIAEKAMDDFDTALAKDRRAFARWSFSRNARNVEPNSHPAPGGCLNRAKDRARLKRSTPKASPQSGRGGRKDY